MKKHVVIAALVSLPVAAAAWQGGMAAIGATESALESQIQRATRQKGDGLSLAFLGDKQLAAAKALPEAQQSALMRELASAARIILMSPAFVSAHDAYIAKEYKAINHGLKVKSFEQPALDTKAGVAEFEMQLKRQMSGIYVQLAMESKIQDLQMMFDESLKEWTKEANKPKGSDKAKYARLVAGAERIKDLSTSDPDKFRRGYAVLRSAENDGLDTEEALFGAQASTQKDAEQLAWDKHNLRGALKRVLAQAVAEAPTVDFAAQTVEKSRVWVFVNPAYEKKSATWKAMYRAGKGPTAAGLQIARAWLKEL
jgi:hypothetical protein